MGGCITAEDIAEKGLSVPYGQESPLIFGDPNSRRAAGYLKTVTVNRNNWFY